MTASCNTWMLHWSLLRVGGCSSIFLPSLDTNGTSFPWDTTFGIICCAQELVLLSAPQRKDWNDKSCKDKGLAAPKTFRACFVPGSMRNALQHQGLCHFLCVFVALKGWGRMASQVHSDKPIYNHSVARKDFFLVKWHFEQTSISHASLENPSSHRNFHCLLFAATCNSIIFCPVHLPICGVGSLNNRKHSVP